MSGKIWTAFKGGTCKACLEPYNKGDKISPIELFGQRLGYRHPNCVYTPPSYEADPNFTPSKEQSAILDYMKRMVMGIATGHRLPGVKPSLSIRARAGSGKTKVLQESVYELAPLFRQFAGRPIKILYLTFSSELVKEAQERLSPEFVESLSGHQVGLRLFLNKRKRRRVSNNKIWDILDEQLPHEKEPGISKEEVRRRLRLKSGYKELVGKMKNTLGSAAECVSRFGLELDPGRDLGYIDAVMADCKRVSHRVDFDDMIWLPLQEGIRPSRYDLVFVDESQDLNRAMIEMVKKFRHPRTGFVFVGDPKQAIYLFRGSEAKMMEEIEEEFDCEVLQMTETRRCARKITALIRANGHVTDFVTARDEEGEVSYRNQDNLSSELTEDHSVLCRYNAPLVALAFSLIGEGKKAQIKGRSIGDNLIKFIDKMGCKKIEPLIEKMQVWLAKEERRLMKLKCRNLDSIMESNENKVRCIEIIAKRCLGREENYVSDIKSEIDKLFADDVKGILLSSIHRSKGLTLEHVVVLGYDELPRPCPDPDQAEQERNLRYVALSRARNKLTLCFKNPAKIPEDYKTRENQASFIRGQFLKGEDLGDGTVAVYCRNCDEPNKKRQVKPFFEHIKDQESFAHLSECDHE